MLPIFDGKAPRVATRENSLLRPGARRPSWPARNKPEHRHDELWQVEEESHFFGLGARRPVLGRRQDSDFGCAGQKKTICDGHDFDEHSNGNDDEKDGNDELDDKDEKHEQGIKEEKEVGR